LRAKTEPTQLEHLSDASFWGKLLVYPPNVILDWQVIASYKHPSLFGLIDSDEGKKSFITLTPNVFFVNARQQKDEQRMSSNGKMGLKSRLVSCYWYWAQASLDEVSVDWVYRVTPWFKFRIKD
jgi:hypothetical protein